MSKYVFQDPNITQRQKYSIEESLSLLTQSQLHQTDVMLKLLAAIVDLKNAINNIPQAEKVVVKEILKESIHSIPKEYREADQGKENIKVQNWLDDKALEIDSILKAAKNIQAHSETVKIIKQNSK